MSLLLLSEVLSKLTYLSSLDQEKEMGISLGGGAGVVSVV